jgi:lipoprotein-anchoring transpeptidase ErfK/SrfK
MRANLDGTTRAVAQRLKGAWSRRRLLGIATLTVAIAAGTQTASVAARGGPLLPTASPVPSSAAAADDPAVKAAASKLLEQYKANPRALATLGRTALQAGRNDATVADFLKLRWVNRLNARLERYGAMLDAARSAQVALGVAGARRTSELIHNALLHDGPDRLIIVSLQTQQMRAYQNGKVIVDTPVTSGRPALPTDVGEMHVVRKDSPWTMKSPWPKGSPDWYPDTPVQMVVWFTSTGEGMHDASWQPAGTYGPDSQTGPYASHGCIHVPLAAETTLFNWATLGTPVVIYPGDGRPLGEQIGQQSVDALGNPISGVRGE